MFFDNKCDSHDMSCRDPLVLLVFASDNKRRQILDNMQMNNIHRIYHRAFHIVLNPHPLLPQFLCLPLLQRQVNGCNRRL